MGEWEPCRRVETLGEWAGTLVVSNLFDQCYEETVGMNRAGQQTQVALGGNASAKVSRAGFGEDSLAEEAANAVFEREDARVG